MRKRRLSSPKEARLDLPLECQDPSDFEGLDLEQRSFLDNGALDLVLIENAAELTRRVMMEKGNLEKILKLFSKTYDGCSVLPSETFPIYTENGNEKWQNTGTKEEYQNLVKEMRKKYLSLAKKQNVDCVYAVFSLLVEVDEDNEDNEGGGHYGSFYINTKFPDRAYIFDSMQNSAKGSHYTIFFSQLAKDIFGVQKVVFDRNFTPETSLQLTGGFSNNPPLMLLYEDDPHHILTEEDKYDVKIQATESQNHFCYMWSIWSLHLRMIGEDPFKIAQTISSRKIDPLVVIKRYIWSLFNYKDLRLIDQIPGKYRNFFEYHWSAIWSNDPIRAFVPNTFFRRYKIPLDSCQDLTQCLKLSYEQINVINEQNLTPLTPSTIELMECARTKK
jgi:hypothetical protein